VDHEGFERFLAVKRKSCLFVQNGRGGWMGVGKYGSMGVWEYGSVSLMKKILFLPEIIDRRPRHQLLLLPSTLP